jgi:hypothetical protein
VSSLDLEVDLDARHSQLELEWWLAFKASVAARADYHHLAASAEADVESIDRAKEQFERSEELKSQIMTKIDRLERRFVARRST